MPRFFPNFEPHRNLSQPDVILYGEGYGPKIQKGGARYREDNSFVLFDINIAGWWLQRKDVEDIGKKLELDVVPIQAIGTLPELVWMVKRGRPSAWGDFPAEGTVARPEVELRSRAGHRIITKLKLRDFV